MSADVEAVILVGGKGTRLSPLTLSAPKPMLPTAGVPLLTHLLSRVKRLGVEHVVLSTSYQAAVFESYFGRGDQLGLDIEYVVEDEPLGTAGAIRNVLTALRTDTALIFNGDILSGVELSSLLARHDAGSADVTLHLTKVADPRPFGCVSTDDSGRVTAFLEKAEEPITDQINAGTYVFNRAVIESIPTGRAVSVERETFPDLLRSGSMVLSHIDSSYWRDLGKPADFVAGSADLVTGVAPTDALPGPGGEALILDGAKVCNTAVVTGGSTIGRDCEIGDGAVIDGAVLFDGTKVLPEAVIRRSIVGNDCLVGNGATIMDAVIADRVRVGAGTELINGVRVWPGTQIADGSIRFSSAR